LADNPAVTIDGCKLACATKMVQESGGQVLREFAVLDVYRRYKQFKPQGIAELNEGGELLAHALAQEAAAVVDELVSGVKLQQSEVSPNG
jgi:predicted lactoylglutathione lyase